MSWFGDLEIKNSTKIIDFNIERIPPNVEMTKEILNCHRCTDEIWKCVDLEIKNSTKIIDLSIEKISPNVGLELANWTKLMTNEILNRYRYSDEIWKS